MYLPGECYRFCRPDVDRERERETLIIFNGVNQKIKLSLCERNDVIRSEIEFIRFYENHVLRVMAETVEST